MEVIGCELALCPKRIYFCDKNIRIPSVMSAAPRNPALQPATDALLGGGNRKCHPEPWNDWGECRYLEPRRSWTHQVAQRSWLCVALGCCFRASSWFCPWPLLSQAACFRPRREPRWSRARPWGLWPGSCLVLRCGSAPWALILSWKRCYKKWGAGMWEEIQGCFAQWKKKNYSLLL